MYFHKILEYMFFHSAFIYFNSLHFFNFQLIMHKSLMIRQATIPSILFITLITFKFFWKVFSLFWFAVLVFIIKGVLGTETHSWTLAFVTSVWGHSSACVTSSFVWLVAPNFRNLNCLKQKISVYSFHKKLLYLFDFSEFTRVPLYNFPLHNISTTRIPERIKMRVNKLLIEVFNPTFPFIAHGGRNTNRGA